MNSQGRIYQTIPLYVRGKETEFPMKLKFLQHKLVITYSSNDTVSIMTSARSSSFYGKVLRVRRPCTIVVIVFKLPRIIIVICGNRRKKCRKYTGLEFGTSKSGLIVTLFCQQFMRHIKNCVVLTSMSLVGLTYDLYYLLRYLNGHGQLA